MEWKPHKTLRDELPREQGTSRAEARGEAYSWNEVRAVRKESRGHGPRMEKYTGPD